MDKSRFQHYFNFNGHKPWLGLLPDKSDFYEPPEPT